MRKCPSGILRSAVAVSREVAKHASLPHTRRAALVVTGYATQKDAIPAEGLSPSVQDCGATCKLWPPAHNRLSRDRRASTTALAVSRKVAKHSGLPRAGAVPRSLRSPPCDTEGHCTDGRPVYSGARPWCDVRALTSSAPPAFAWRARKPHCAGCVTGGGETRARSACRPSRAGCDRSTCNESELLRREASLLRCKTVVRRASCGLQCAAGIRMSRAQAPLRWLSLGRWRNRRACRAHAVLRWL